MFPIDSEMIQASFLTYAISHKSQSKPQTTVSLVCLQPR